MSDALVIDAHQHFLDPARAEYPWLTDEVAPLRRRFAPEDLREPMRETGVDATILVQTRSSFDETLEFVALARETDFIAGVVGWVDLTDEAVAERIAELKEQPGGHLLVGVRHQVHDEEDPRWLLRTEVQRGLQAIGEAGLAYDLLVRPRELPAALETVRRNPEVRFVIDHIGKPEIATGEIEVWSERMAPFAETQHVACKLSGMVTEADWRRWTSTDFVPYVEHVMQWFGAERLMYGSDWPVCLLAASYGDVRQAAGDALGEISASDRDRIFGGTAADVYRIATR